MNQKIYEIKTTPFSDHSSRGVGWRLCASDCDFYMCGNCVIKESFLTPALMINHPFARLMCAGSKCPGKGEFIFVRENGRTKLKPAESKQSSRILRGLRI